MQRSVADGEKSQKTLLVGVRTGALPRPRAPCSGINLWPILQDSLGQKDALLQCKSALRTAANDTDSGARPAYRLNQTKRPTEHFCPPMRLFALAPWIAALPGKPSSITAILGWRGLHFLGSARIAKSGGLALLAAPRSASVSHCLASGESNGQTPDH